MPWRTHLGGCDTTADGKRTSCNSSRAADGDYDILAVIVICIVFITDTMFLNNNVVAFNI